MGYDFFPRTYCLPEMWSAFAEHFTVPAGVSDTAGIRRSKHVFIVKPAASCQGRGIYLTRALSEVDQRVASIAQRYIGKPFLIDGLKFDLRIYVLVSCVEPLRIWLFDDGLARFATTPYAAPSQRNMSDMTTHLTNYAIKKQSANFVFNTGGVEGSDTGSKRSLTWFKGWLDSHGYSSRLVFGRIEHMINKALIAAQPHLSRMYRSAAGGEGASISGSHSRCFEVLGLDVLLDSRLRPWLIEVNHSPSFTCDTPLDLDIKTRVIGEAIDLMRLRVSERNKLKESQDAATRQRLYGGGSAAAASAAAVGAGGASARPLQRAPSVGSELPPRARSAAPTAGGEATVAGRLLEFRDGVAAGGAARDRDYNPGAGVDRGMLQHEAATARDYRIIYPVPDPSAVTDAVFAENAALAARMAASLETLNAPKAKASKARTASATSDAAAGVDADESAADAAAAGGPPTSLDDEPAVGFAPSPPPAMMSPTAAAAVTGDAEAEAGSGGGRGGAGSSAVRLRRVSAHELQLRGRVLKEQLRRPDDARSDSEESAGSLPAAATAGAGAPSSPSSRPRLLAAAVSPVSSSPRLAARPASARLRATPARRGSIDAPLAPPSPDGAGAASGRSTRASLHVAQLTAVVASSLRSEARSSPKGPTGVPPAYAVPWDASREALETRLKQYRAYALVSQELHEIELVGASGRRVNEQQLAATAAIIAAAAHSVSDGGVKPQKGAAGGSAPSAAAGGGGATTGSFRGGASSPTKATAPSPVAAADPGLSQIIRTVRALAGVAGKPSRDDDAEAPPASAAGWRGAPGAGSCLGGEAPVREAGPAPLVPRVAVLAAAKQAAEAARRAFAEESRLGSIVAEQQQQQLVGARLPSMSPRGSPLLGASIAAPPSPTALELMRALGGGASHAADSAFAAAMQAQVQRRRGLPEALTLSIDSGGRTVSVREALALAAASAKVGVAVASAETAAAAAAIAAPESARSFDAARAMRARPSSAGPERPAAVRRPDVSTSTAAADVARPSPAGVAAAVPVTSSGSSRSAAPPPPALRRSRTSLSRAAVTPGGAGMAASRSDSSARLTGTVLNVLVSSGGAGHFAPAAAAAHARRLSTGGAPADAALHTGGLSRLLNHAPGSRVSTGPALGAVRGAAAAQSVGGAGAGAASVARTAAATQHKLSAFLGAPPAQYRAGPGAPPSEDDSSRFPAMPQDGTLGRSPMVRATSEGGAVPAGGATPRQVRVGSGRDLLSLNAAVATGPGLRREGDASVASEGADPPQRARGLPPPSLRDLLRHAASMTQGAPPGDLAATPGWFRSGAPHAFLPTQPPVSPVRTPGATASDATRT